MAGDDASGKGTGRPRIRAGVPVYDEVKGGPFGVVVVEIDFLAQAEHLLDRHTGGQSDVFITNRAGRIWARTQQGRGASTESGLADISAIFPRAAEFFRSNNYDSVLVAPDSGVVASRIRLNQTDAVCSVGIVARLAD
jgi:hypothetical protein